MDKSKTFCIIPWIHLNTWPNGNVFQCCITDYRNHIGSLTTETLEEVWNNDYMQNLRVELLHDKQPSGCTKCFEQEANNITSFRQTANKKFSSHIDEAYADTTDSGYVENFKLAYWDFRFSNLCNMKCRMCGGHLSSLWNADEMKIYNTTHKRDAVVNTREHCVDDLYGVLDEQMDNVEEIYFAGGEPLIMEEHYYILEQLIKHKKTHVRLRYNTNLSKLTYKKWNVVELWEHFDNVQVIASLDAMGPRAEYIRKGTVWSTIDKNLRTLIANKHIMVGVSPTVQILNIFHLPEFIDYLIDMGIVYHELHLNNVLTNPLWYHINTLTPIDKVRVEALLHAHCHTIKDDTMHSTVRQQYNSIISYMNSELTEEQINESKRTFVNMTTKLDALRDEDFITTFPELLPHWEYSNS